MTKHDIERLPTETLREICEYLDRGSVLSFALVNARCRRAANEIIFRHVDLKYTALDQWIKVIDSASSLQHVRSIKLVASHITPTNSPLLDCGDRPFDTWQYGAANMPKALDQYDAPWLPMAHLIQKLPGLRDFTWGNRYPIPPCILKTLHTDKPKCRLHIQSFLLHSLIQPLAHPILLDSHELMLATSSCLQSVALRLDYLDGIANYNESAIMDMVAGAAPNLQKVSLFWDFRSYFPSGFQASRLSKKQWRRDVFGARPSTIRLGALTCLELSVPETESMLQTWSAKTDFSVLRTLKLHSSVNAEGLRWLAEGRHFSSLATLVISPRAAEIGEQESNELYAATKDFLRSLPPLRCLKITRDYNQSTLEVALNCHGQTLRQLLLFQPAKDEDNYDQEGNWIFSHDILEMIRSCCPILEEIALPIKRSLGDATEVASYRALGSFRTIRRMHLSLDCLQSCATDYSTLSDFDKQPFDPQTELHNIDVGNALINYSIDERLATAIFKTISGSKAPYSPSLERLELRVQDDYAPRRWISPSYTLELMEYFIRSWVCERNPRDDYAHQCAVREYDQNERTDREQSEAFGYGRCLDDSIEPIFRRIWQGSPDEDWRKAWHSLPLTNIEDVH